MRILLAYASADGSTAEIADRIAGSLGGYGYEAIAVPVGEVGELSGFDAVVVGSAVHARQWLDDATTFVNTHRAALRSQPLYTFSVGMPDALPRFVRRLARTEESAIVLGLGDPQPAGHRLFSGVVKPSQFPLASRIFLRLAGGHYGDFRDWAAIDAWAAEIAGQLRPQAPSAPTEGTSASPSPAT
jgi:menaquinone-dependent protoporphyrinogen oxidase